MKKLAAYPVYLFLEGGWSLIFAAIFTANLVYHAEVARLTPLQLVLTGTALEAAVFLFEIPTGIVADVYSRRLSIIIGTLMMGAAFIVESQFPFFWPIILMQIVWGIGYTFTSGATQAWISDEIGEEAAGKAFLRAAQVGQLVALIGIAISAFLGSLSAAYPIFLGGVLLLVQGIVLTFVMPETGFHPVQSPERNTWQKMGHIFHSGIAEIHLHPTLLTVLAIGLFYGLYSEAFDRLWTRHLLSDIGLPRAIALTPVAWIAIINTVGALLSAAAAGIVHRRLDTNRSLPVAQTLLVVTLVLIVGLLGYALIGNFILALGLLWIIRVCRELIGPIHSAWVNQRLDPQVRATVLSMSGQVDAIGQIAGGPPLGLIGSLLSVRAALTASALLLTPILALYGRALRISSPAAAVSVEDQN